MENLQIDQIISMIKVELGHFSSGDGAISAVLEERLWNSKRGGGKDGDPGGLHFFLPLLSMESEISEEKEYFA